MRVRLFECLMPGDRGRACGTRMLQVKQLVRSNKTLFDFFFFVELFTFFILSSVLKVAL